jgi:hypothetical protein
MLENQLRHNSLHNWKLVHAQDLFGKDISLKKLPYFA